MSRKAVVNYEPSNQRPG